MRLSRRRAARHRQGVHRGLRLELPRRRWWPSTPLSTGSSCRPRSTSPASSATATRCSNERTLCVGRQPVGRDPRHRPRRCARRRGSAPRCSSSPTSSTPPWPAPPTACSTPGPGPRSAWPPPSATWPRSWRSRCSACTWPRSSGRCRRRRSTGSSTPWRRCPGSWPRPWAGPATSTTWRPSSPTPRDFFFLGRHVGYPVALEGALKLKEIAYLRAEGYPAGELKHGPIALIEPGTVVVGIATRNPLWEKMLSNVAEVRRPGRHRGAAGRRRRRGDGRRGRPRAVGARRPTRSSRRSSASCRCSNSPTAWPACTGTTPDRPRNLAKTVTVE